VLAFLVRAVDMRAAGRPHRNPVGIVVALLCIAAAVAVALYVNHRDNEFPSSDDVTIDADVVHVASTIDGRIIEILVKDNQLVAKGDVLFRLDPEPYELAVQQAKADLGIARAAVGTQQRVVSTEASNAAVAHAQVTRAQTNYDLAARTVERLRPLATQSYIPTQQFDQAQVVLRDAATSLAQAKQQEAAARTAVGTLEGSEAAVQAREAALAIAQRALRQTVVYAPVDGRVTGINVKAGEILAPSQSLFTLINSSEWFAVANVREVDLKRIGIGDCATVYSMIDRRRPIAGKVVSVGFGVQSDDRLNLPRSLPVVVRTMDWVRVAQRFPVRIELEHAPEPLMRVGATASVEIRYGPSCR
jgi:membrane fusion protein, multidrug efflux system